MEAALEALHMTVTEHGVVTMADIPCGDFNWMPLFLDAAPFLTYQGFDIVPDIIAENRRRYPTRSFEELDITREVPPRTDLIFCKDLLNHLTFLDVRAALQNMRRSGARLLLASNNFGLANVDLPLLALRTSRHLDINLPPLNAPPPFGRRPTWVSGGSGIFLTLRRAKPKANMMDACMSRFSCPHALFPVLYTMS